MLLVLIGFFMLLERHRITVSSLSKHTHVPYYIAITSTLARYVPYVGDSKRAMDEYTSEIFMGGKVRRAEVIQHLCGINA
jgi:myo-inositol-1-phosphate synthase